ncbi:MAG: 50S ribosomal protein L4 [Anaerolineaceae bacterium]|nr:50S ribosomal protein L4 [Anaerolineaceae bacterium]
MLEIPVYDATGKSLKPIEVDEALFGSKVRRELLRLAILRIENNQRPGTAATKSRGMVRGSTRKLFRQKGTGRARMGANRTGLRRGGGVTFAKRVRSFGHGMPKKARRVALDSALLAKMLDGEVMVLSKLEIDEPKTRRVVDLLKALKVEGTCLLSIAEPDENVWKSARNVARLRVSPVSDLNVWEVIWPRRLVFTREAFSRLVSARSK